MPSPEENKTSSRAKHFHGTEKSDFIRTTFNKKLDNMEAILKKWKVDGVRGTEYWPSDLRSLKLWEDEDAGIFSWSSNSITWPRGKYSAEVARFWQLHAGLSSFEDSPKNLKERNRRLVLLNKNLAEQNSALLWAIADFRDEIARVSPGNIILSRHVFP